MAKSSNTEMETRVYLGYLGLEELKRTHHDGESSGNDK